MLKKAFSFGLMAVLAGCSSGQSTKLAEDGVVNFHRSFNASDAKGIYERSDAVMKKAAPRDGFIKLMNLFRSRLGQFQSGKTIGWFENYGTGGHIMTINRDAKFEKGDGQEQFVFRIGENGAALVGYHVNSMALLGETEPKPLK